MLDARFLLRVICTEYDTWLKIQFICSSREAYLDYMEDGYLPKLPRRRLWLLSSTWCRVACVQFGELLRILLFLFLAAQLPRSLQTSFLLLALDLLAVDNLHGACHAFLFSHTLVLAVLVHARGSDNESTDCPVGCRLNGC